MKDPERRSDDIDAEIEDHIERRAADLRRTGLSDDAAYAQALDEFGDPVEARRQLLMIDRRIETRQRRARIWFGVGRDVTLAARRLVARPVSTLAIVLSLALAIGIGTAVFSIVDQTLLRRPPFAHADRLVDVHHVVGPKGGSARFFPQKIVGWQEQTALFERFEAYAPFGMELTSDESANLVRTPLVSLGLFEMLGIRPAIGRLFGPGDGAAGSEKVAILSHAFWRSRYAGARDVLGSVIDLNDDSYTIVGVFPHGMTLVAHDDAVYLPFDLHAWGAARPRKTIIGLGRLQPGVEPEHAQEIVDQIATRLEETSAVPGGWHLGVMPKKAANVSVAWRTTLLVLLGAVGLLLLIACVNVTSATVSEVWKRRRETAVRTALGAARWRLMREVLVETILLALIAGLASIAIAFAALDLFTTVVIDGFSFAFMSTRPIEIDLRVLAVMTAATFATGVLSGLYPAFRASRVDSAPSLANGARGSAMGLRTAGLLVAAEVALATVVLVGTALMSRTLIAFYSLEPGFDVERLVAATVRLPAARYSNEEARSAFFDNLDTLLRRHPAIESTATAWGLPPGSGGGVALPQTEDGFVGQEVQYFANVVSPTYFAATGTKLIAGRTFTPDDRDDHVIISDGFARLLWGNALAVGKRFRESPHDRWVTVVGVAADVEARTLHGDRSRLQLYVPFLRTVEMPAETRTFAQRSLIMRASEGHVPAEVVRTELASLDPSARLGELTTGLEIYAEPIFQQRLLLKVMGVLAGTALLLAAVGIFGVLTQSVTMRRREIGIRLALGARRESLARRLVGHGVVLATGGLVAGGIASFWAGRLLESLLFETSPFDPASFAAVAAVLMAVSLCACWWPTRRALAVEPAEVLRSE